MAMDFQGSGCSEDCGAHLPGSQAGQSLGPRGSGDWKNID